MPLQAVMLLCCAVATWCAAAIAQADPPAPAAAEPDRYFAEIQAAVAAFDAGDWSGALAGFERAHALQPSARTWRGIALAAFYAGDCVRARYATEAAVHETNRPLTDPQRGELNALVSPCSQTTGRLELRVTPPDASVAVNGEPLAGTVLIAPAGAHRLEAHAPGRTPLRRELQIAAGQAETLELELELPLVSEPNVAEAPVPAGVSHGTDAQRSPRPLRTAAWISTASVPVFLGAAATVWLVGLAEHDAVDRKCRELGCDSAETQRRIDAAGLASYERWTNVALVAAGAAAVTASVLWLADAGRDEGPPALSVELSPLGGRLHGRL